MIKRYVRDGEMCPRFYGVAYYSHCMEYNVAYPVPFHKIVGWWRYLWMILKAPPRTFRLSALHEIIRKQQQTIDTVNKSLCIYREPK